MSESKQWHLGAMNDGLFIIDRPPRPSTDDVWHERPDGPTLVLPVHGLPIHHAQSICNAHNASLGSMEFLIDALIIALPYIEEAEPDPAYEKGAVRKVINQITAAIAKAEFPSSEDNDNV